MNHNFFWVRMRRFKGEVFMVMKRKQKHHTNKSKAMMINRAGIYWVNKMKCWRRLLPGVEGKNK